MSRATSATQPGQAPHATEVRTKVIPGRALLVRVAPFCGCDVGPPWTGDQGQRIRLRNGNDTVCEVTGDPAPA